MHCRALTLSILAALKLAYSFASENNEPDFYKELISQDNKAINLNCEMYISLIDKTIDCITELNDKFQYRVFTILNFKDSYEKMQRGEKYPKFFFLHFEELIKFFRHIENVNSNQILKKLEYQGKYSIEKDTANLKEKIKEVEQIMKHSSIKNLSFLVELLGYIINRDILNNAFVGTKDDLEKILNEQNFEEIGLNEPKIKSLIDAVAEFELIRLDMYKRYDMKLVSLKLSEAISSDSSSENSSDFDIHYLYVDSDYTIFKKYNRLLEKENENRKREEELRLIREKLLELEQERLEQKKIVLGNNHHDNDQYYYN